MTEYLARPSGSENPMHRVYGLCGLGWHHLLRGDEERALAMAAEVRSGVEVGSRSRAWFARGCSELIDARVAWNRDGSLVLADSLNRYLSRGHPARGLTTNLSLQLARMYLASGRFEDAITAANRVGFLALLSAPEPEIEPYVEQLRREVRALGPD